MKPSRMARAGFRPRYTPLPETGEIAVNVPLPVALYLALSKAAEARNVSRQKLMIELVARTYGAAAEG